MKKSIGVIFAFLFVLVACKTSSEISAVPAIIQPTSTAFIPPISTEPTIPTVDPLTPTAIAQFFLTLEVTTVTPKATVMPDYEECSYWDELTEDRNWALCDPRMDPITLVNKSNQIWEFSYNTYYGESVLNHCTHLLYSTNDGEYLYFSLDEDCIKTEPGFVSSIGVFRINLISGDTKEILKASYDFETYSGDYYTVSISPTGRRMAYIRHSGSPLTLTILDLQTGEERSFPLDEKYGSGGMFTWSDDGTKLAFMLESEKDYDHFISMVFLDLLKDNSMMTFIKDKDFDWISSRIEVTDNGVKIAPYFDAPLFYDVETGILSPTTE